jgi:Fur family ferric uptake transcriptional regulator
MTAPSLDRDVEQRLHAHGVRYTKGRRAVVGALARSDGPQSAAELHGAIGPEVPLSSLYRSLAVLEHAGIVTPHFGAKGLTRYELDEWLTGHHHHLICIECGSVEDVEIPHAIESQLRQLVDAIGSLASFDPAKHELEIEGRCPRCT